jgi:phosphatidylserine decarboxylase
MKDPVLRFMWKIAPKHSLSRLFGTISKKAFSRHFIPYYVRKFQIDLSPVKQSMDQFNCLLDFFVRELKPDARPIHADPDIVISPVDGVITQMGRIEEGTLIQAKGIHYQLEELLAGGRHVSTYTGGQFMTIYLSPRDYHRIHSPIDGEVTSLTYVPGKLYPVNTSGVRLFPRLFTQNERVISYIKSNANQVAVVKVGATNVGSIKVTFDQTISTNRQNSRLTEEKEYHGSVVIKKGEELGRFEFGSTVILLLESNNMVEWLGDLTIGTPLQMGQPIAKVIPRKKD